MGSLSAVLHRSVHDLICLLRREWLAGRQVRMQVAWVGGDFNGSDQGESSEAREKERALVHVSKSKLSRSSDGIEG